MITKNEFLYIGVQIEKITDILFDFEFKSEIFRSWKKWIALPEERKQSLLRDWELYYKEGCTHPIGLKFTEAVKAFKSRDTQLLQKITIEIKDLPVRKTPSSIDPEDLERQMSSYFQMQEKLKQNSKILAKEI